MELAVIGKSEFVTGFRLAGISKVYETPDIPATESAVRSVLEDKSVGILVMHNDDIGNLPEVLRKNLNESVQPTVVALGGSGSGSTSLREKIKQAVGVDLWK
ncbi:MULTISPECIES: V-type ATP synthase subunit F [Methanosarcina]|jgi:V/A-type H+-transporting ATPase subunit F|uniref:A-type ATP synthase subunit F n=7 Tax=Methanosarcina mazei TaxID=2209 RepID=AATF_METMA|nr:MULTISPECIES: V-type ATP synthase subunit F [Methanosarcina]Q60185.1 RecName: Full=V-type ATP synthase subunit F; AltName: Full=V-ATPase subunit F [Methanosarcina mazei Go1]2OV6_A Chain A, V-type ATP synthase subunit F [Methanosarcina mazei Go1]AAC06374.1 A1AO H+ ATPase, subunit F [Methanosarcina mazei Go1]AAM30477.1 A1AO H+ ATPase subunit F [Methanosarcina mazei Go1]AKB39529.1 V-type ATP synthase subunit F [Methanosarcina mazei WWM610]AKB60502.1 V-type ATP synthase subunit F [Methanosarci